RGEAAGGVGQQDRRPVPPDDPQGGADLRVVAVQVVDLGGGLPRQQAAAVLAQVQSPHVVPVATQVLHQLAIQDVVRPPVHEEDGRLPAGRGAGRSTVDE